MKLLCKIFGHKLKESSSIFGKVISHENDQILVCKRCKKIFLMPYLSKHSMIIGTTVCGAGGSNNPMNILYIPGWTELKSEPEFDTIFKENFWDILA